MAAWFAGTREGTPDNRIVLWRDGATSVLDTGRDVAHWNPVLADGPDGLLWLFCKVGPRISEWITLVTRSPDGGATWEPARELVPGDTSGGRGPVRTPPLRTEAGSPTDELRTSGGRDFRHIRCNGKRGHLKRVVAAFLDKSKSFFQFPTLKNFIADRKFHRNQKT